MNRKAYMIKCQACAVLENGPGRIKKDVPKDIRVKFDGVEYYPTGYKLTFDKFAKAIHSAILHDLNANCEILCSLEQVEEVEQVTE